jgi:hypothetical protein
LQYGHALDESAGEVGDASRRMIWRECGS